MKTVRTYIFFGLLLGFFAVPTATSAATLYFNGAVNNNWATLGNWWTNAGFTATSSAVGGPSDDVIVSAAIFSNSGAPASVNTLVLNGSNPFGISVSVANGATFNDSSYLDSNRTITGNSIFNDTSSSNGTITGNAIFNDASRLTTGTITGNATFNTTHYNTSAPSGGIFVISGVGGSVWAGSVTGTVYGSDNQTITSYVFNNGSSLDGGTLEGDVTFNDTSANYGAIITGDATFNTTYYGPAPTNGVFILNDDYWYGSVSGNVYGSDDIEITSYVFNSMNMFSDSVVNGDATFNGNAALEDDATLNGNATFNDDGNNSGTINGDVIFNDDSSNFTGTINGDVIFNNDSYNDEVSIINGDVTFNNASINYYSTITGNVIFNGTSYSGYSTSSPTNIIGNAVFNNSSINTAFGTVTGNACFGPSATNSGTVNGTVSVCSTPTVTSSSATSLTKTNATLNGTLTSLGGSAVTQHGFTYGTNSSLTTVIATTTLGTKSSTGTFDLDITSLNCGNTYYFRPYVTNGSATSFGSITSFTTSSCTSGGGGGSSRTPTTPTTPITPSTPSTSKTTSTEIFQLLDLLGITLTTQQRAMILVAFPATTSTTPTYTPPTTTPTSQSTCTALTYEMWIGHTDFNTNNEVSKLQLFLIDKGYLPNETPLGYYGPLTASAITKFQLEKGIVTGGTLSTTGIGGVGPRTIGAIQDASCY